MEKVKVKSAENMGKLFVNNNYSVIGHDGAYSIPLDDGRVFWTFGDTLLGFERKDYDPTKIMLDEWLAQSWAKENVNMIGNTSCFVNVRNASELVDTQPVYINEKNTAKEIIKTTLPPNRAGRYRPLWPMDGIFLNGNLYVFYIAVDCGPANPEQEIADINVYGAGVAKASFPYTEFKRLTPTVLPNVPKDIANYNEYPYLWWNCDLDENLNQVPAFGTAVVKEVIDGYVYIFGSLMRKVDKRIVHGVALARVKVKDIEDITKFEYLQEDLSWGKDPKKSKIVFEGNANELSVSYNKYLGKFIAIYSYVGEIKNNKLNRFLEEIHLRYADELWGEWSEPQVIYKCEKSLEKDTCYAGKEHPEYSEKDGKIIYITYVSHQRYWPELIRVEFE